MVKRALALGALLVCLTPAAASAGPVSPPGAAAVAGRYWTAERMAAARPLDAAPAGPVRGAPAGTPVGKLFAGVPTVGTFFAKTSLGDTWCSGSVLDSPGRDLALTAGHCALGLEKGSYPIFVPKYQYGAATQPYGMFTVQKVFRDPRFLGNSETALSNLDFALLRLAPGGPTSDRPVQDVVGAGLKLTPTPGFRNTVTVVGYPSRDSDNPRHQAITCTVPTVKFSSFHQLKMLCGGYATGVSGGPWITGLDPVTGAGTVVGVVGGYNGGGDDAGSDWVSYSPMFDEQITALYDDAVNDRRPQRDPYLPPTGGAGNVFTGAAGRWAGARLMAAGPFSSAGRSDLLVVWADGGISLHVGDGAGGFRAEKRLLAANSRWASAVTVTAGDFDGGAQYDLLVRWASGGVSTFTDTSAAGLGKETVLAKAGDKSWVHADQVVAGNFGTKNNVTDLMVRWDDGRLTLYTKVGGGKFGTATALAAKGSVWKKATLLSAGQYSGSNRWDLLARWVDGEVDNYANTGPGGLGAEARIADANKVWAATPVMATGAFTANGRVDDLVAVRAGGETVLYSDSRRDQLGPVATLVAADR